MSSDEYISKYASTKNKKGYLSNSVDTKYLSEVKKKTSDELVDIDNYFMNKNIKYNLDSRIFYNNHIRKKIKNVSSKQCLSVSKTSDTMNPEYNIKNTIILTRRFGTSSVYGYIYIAKIKNEIGSRPIAAKLMVRNYRNLLESTLNEKITEKIVKNKISRHFILTYKAIYCNVLSDKNTPRIISGEKYIILLNELAHGDYKSLCKKKDFLKDNKVLYNIFIQMMLSIMTLHSFGYIHRDCHWGNFLYHNNNEKGYYQYKINGQIYYLEACPYSIYLYDFGIAKEINDSHIKYIPEDYVRITGAFRNKNNYYKSWLAKINIPSNLPSKEISVFGENFGNQIINFYNKNKSAKSSTFLNKITQELINIFLNIPHNMFTDKKPLNSKIINSTPFIIEN
jgi:hypothetical protein